MKVLVLGNPNDNYVQEFIEYVLLDGGHQVWIASFIGREALSGLYGRTNVHVIDMFPSLGFLNRIPRVAKVLWKVWRAVRFFEKYDAVHVLYVRSYRFIQILLLFRPRLIYSYFGSDLLRKNEAVLAKERKMLKKASYITLNTKHMAKRFRETYADAFDGRIRIVRYGVLGFDAIDRIAASEGKDACKEYFSIEADQTVISIGYNRSSAQQHLEVLKALTALTEDERNKIHIVLQMTYGGMPDGYLEEVVQATCALGCSYTVFSEFMSGEDVARLRIATDIFIHAQTSDAFSATVQEYLYCGADVINPAWISYEELKEYDIRYTEFSQFSELSVIVSVKLREGFQSNDSNKKKLWALSSWESVKDQWLELYNGL